MSAVRSTPIVKEKGIIFSGESVRAILEGRKTQTRRIIKPQPDITEERLHADGLFLRGHAIDEHVNEAFQAGFIDVQPPCDVGDVLWVRETFRAGGENKPIFAADGPDASVKWTSPIYMPRAFARITLVVEWLRVERLQTISEEDCLAEGVKRTEHRTYIADGVEFATAVTAFSFGWDGINGKRAEWSTNPWLWVIGFRRLTNGVA